MEEKFNKNINRMALADHLETMARQLRDGQFQTDSGTWPVPETLKTQIKVIEKKGRLQTRIKFKWSTVDHYTPPEKAAVVDWENRFKVAKKQLSRSFKELSRPAGQDVLPHPEVVDRYLHDSADFEALSQEQWPDEMAVYRDHVMSMKRAVDGGRLADFQHEVRDIRAAMVACHRAFK